MGLLIGGYEWGRHLVSGQTTEATANARSIWRLQQMLQVPTEAAVQHWAIAWQPLAKMANIYYVSAHFPTTVVVLVWLFVRHHRSYLRVRSQLALATAAGLLVHMVFPLSPPRLMPEFGMVDTMVTIGPSAYPAGPPTQSNFVNQYAAMPSLHVGWALLMAIAIITVAKSKWRWLALLHPAATWFVVVVTANHYWLDGLVGGLLVIGAIGVTMAIARFRQRSAVEPVIPVSPSASPATNIVIPVPRAEPGSAANVARRGRGLVRRP